MKAQKKLESQASSGLAQAAAPALEQETTAQAGRSENQEIARLAYSYWEERGCPIGSPEQDWLRAEYELHARQSANSAAAG